MVTCHLRRRRVHDYLNIWLSYSCLNSLMAPKNLKRVRQGEEDAADTRVPEQSLVEKFSELSKKLGSPEAAILSLMRFFLIEVDSIKSPFPEKLASFSNAEYSKTAPFFNMNPEYCASDWEPFEVLRVTLPSSIKDELLKAGAKAFRLSGPPNRQPNEGTRVGFLSTVSQMILVQILFVCISSSSGCQKLSHCFLAVFMTGARNQCQGQNWAVEDEWSMRCLCGKE